jgi:hypothetical protein
LYESRTAFRNSSLVIFVRISKDGAAIPSDGNIIYIIKGGGKQDFWKYVPGTPGNWIPLDIIPKLNKKVFPRAVLRLLILMDMFIC